MEDEEGESIDVEERGSGERNGSDGVLTTLVGAVAEIIRGVLRQVALREFSEVHSKYRRVERKFRTLALLALAFLLFGIVTQVVWLLVGIAWLGQNTVLPSASVVFLAGVVVGYLVCLATGLVYMRS
ncbi:MAG: hypothetical protein SV760_02340 [Halobacteria archaeon]|nr:hypothetical protein [Halobacteria archaeon]